MSTMMTSKGQVTIPKRLRDHLGLKTGHAVDFDLTASGDVVVRKAHGKKPKSRFEALLGSAGPGPSTDEIMEMLRGE